VLEFVRQISQRREIVKYQWREVMRKAR
jgi:hypothetical protein